MIVARRLAIVTLVATTYARAHADGLVIGGGSPRAIGRAGVGTVGDDGGGALLVNPAAMARRDATRIQLGVAFVDDAIAWDRAVSAPVARDQSGSSTLPLAAIEGTIGDWVIGAGVMTSTATSRALRVPGRIPASDYGNTFEYRYTGLEGALRRDTVTLGIARRLGDAVAIGIAVANSRVEMIEGRRIWAGFVDRKDVLGDPSHDVEIGITADDWWSPSVVAGVLVAPADTRVELGASIAWTRTAHLAGDVTASGMAPAVSVAGSDATARLALRQPITVRTGARWLGEHWIGEVGGDLWIVSDAAATPVWSIHNLSVVDQSGAFAVLSTLPSRASMRTHGALRGALDVELIEGFLWATGGYAYTTAGTAPSRMSPTFGDLGGHTAALGLEASVDGLTLSLGWARTWSIKLPVPDPAWRLDNPFNAGDGPVPAGTYDGSSDMVGLSVDAEL